MYLIFNLRKNIDKNPKSDFVNSNKISCINDFSKKPSLLLRKSDLDVKMNLSPKPIINEYAKFSKYKSTDYNSLSKRSNFTSVSKETTANFNDDLVIKKTLPNNKKDSSN